MSAAVLVCSCSRMDVAAFWPKHKPLTSYGSLYLPMLPQQRPIVANHNSSIPQHIPMGLIPLQDGGDDDHVMLAGIRLQPGHKQGQRALLVGCIHSQGSGMSLQLFKGVKAWEAALLQTG